VVAVFYLHGGFLVCKRKVGEKEHAHSFQEDYWKKLTVWKKNTYLY
jgi:hypothetical protein